MVVSAPRQKFNLKLFFKNSIIFKKDIKIQKKLQNPPKLTSELVKQLCGSSRFRRLFLGDGDVGVGGGITPVALCLNTISLSLCSGDDESLLNRFKLMSGACADGVDGAYAAFPEPSKIARPSN